MSDQVDLVWIVPPRVGGFDVVLSILCGLRETGAVGSCMLVVEDAAAYRVLDQAPFLTGLTADLVDAVWPIFGVEPQSGPRVLRNPVGRARRLAAVLRLVAAVARRRRPVLLHASKRRRRLIDVLARIVRGKNGMVVYHPAAMAVGKPDGQSVPTGAAADLALRFLAQSCDGRPVDTRRIDFGFPRMSRAWKNRVERWVVESLSGPALEGAEAPILVILMPSTVAKVFSRADLVEWCTQLAAAIGATYPDASVVLKPHPLLSEAQIRGAIAAIEPIAASTTVSWDHPAVLSHIADCIVTAHSTTVLDALASGRPVVGFQKADEKWRARHPEGSWYLEKCPVWAQTGAELRAALADVRAGRYPAAALSDLCPEGAFDRLATLLASGRRAMGGVDRLAPNESREST